MFLRFSHFKAVSDAMYAILKYEFALFFVLKPSRCAETMCAINLSIFTLFSIVQYFELDYYRSRCAMTMCAINFALFALFSILQNFAPFSILHYFDWIETGVQIPCVLPSILHQLDDHYFASALLCFTLLCFASALLCFALLCARVW